MKKIIYVFLFLFIGTLNANAYVDSQQMTSEQALINAGYSKDLVKTVSFDKQNPYDTIDEKSDKRTILQKLYNYIDPCSETNRAFPAHDIKPTNGWQNL